MGSKAGKKKFYAVRKGHIPGIYLNWPDCEKQVKGFSGGEYKSFATREEAEQYIGPIVATTSGSAIPKASPRPSGPAIPKASPRPSRQSPEPAKRSRSPSPGRGQSFIEDEDDAYLIEFDGAAKGNPGPAGAGALVRAPDGSVVCELREGLGTATNNVAEYRAFILGLKGALDRGLYRVKAQGDSNLLVRQILGRYKVKHPNLIPLSKEAQKLVSNFADFAIRHVDREFNSAADKLANEAVFLPETPFISSFPEEDSSKTEGG